MPMYTGRHVSKRAIKNVQEQYAYTRYESERVYPYTNTCTCPHIQEDMFQTAQSHMIKSGHTAEQHFTSLVGRSRELSHHSFAKWFVGIDPSLRLSEIHHLYSMFKSSASGGGISRQAFVLRFTSAASEERERALRWLRNQLYIHKMTLDDFLAGADVNRDDHISKDELLAAAKRVDPVLSSGAARNLVQGLCPTDTGPKVDIRSLRQGLKTSAAQEDDREHKMLDQLRAAMSQDGQGPEAFFRKWDADGDGSMSESELMRGVESLGLVLDSWETRRLLRLADADNSGTLDVREFFERFGAVSPDKGLEKVHLCS